MIVKDRIALDLKQIELVIRIELLQALERVLPQIEAVLRLSRHRSARNSRLNVGNRVGQRSRHHNEPFCQ
jgi:hypothetical protein